jgi:hypothetical protein
VDLDYGSFQIVLRVLKLSMNLLFIYQITHSGIGKRVEFTPDSVIISDMVDGFRVAV